MNYENKFQFAQQEMAVANISSFAGVPPFVKILRKLGIKSKPPHYNSFLSNFLKQGMSLCFCWGIFAYFVLWRPQSFPLSTLVVSSIGVGVFYGAVISFYLKHGAKKHKLTSWLEIGNA